MISIILQSALLSIIQLFSLDMRRIFWRILAISIIVLIIAWISFHHIFGIFIMTHLNVMGPVSMSMGWWSFILLISLALGINRVLYFLLVPLITFIGSFYADDIIEIIEEKHFSYLPKGRRMSNGEAFTFSFKFFLLSIFGNAIALLLYFILPIHLLAFYFINSYILGKTYFTINALRFESYEQALRLFNKNILLVFICGLIMSFVASLPILNLVAPLFSASFMTYIYKNIKGARLAD